MAILVMSNHSKNLSLKASSKKYFYNAKCVLVIMSGFVPGCIKRSVLHLFSLHFTKTDTNFTFKQNVNCFLQVVIAQHCHHEIKMDNFVVFIIKDLSFFFFFSKRAMHLHNL